MGRLSALGSSPRGWLSGGLPVAALVLFGDLHGAEEQEAQQLFRLTAVQELDKVERDIGLALSDARVPGAICYSNMGNRIWEPI